MVLLMMLVGPYPREGRIVSRLLTSLYTEMSAVTMSFRV